ncbi:uncharacterized protein BDV17DRAFT_273558 [Aspergillus undulatus]|uniref:uncharacterized protein n=1 Tax=Aspergillus undulatus TaxID=1810928 RepID=UPI003CCDC551
MSETDRSSQTVRPQKPIAQRLPTAARRLHANVYPRPRLDSRRKVSLSIHSVLFILPSPISGTTVGDLGKVVSQDNLVWNH